MINNKGFTLTEIMVTVLLVAILASIAIPQYMKVVERQRSVEALGILSAIAKSQERFFSINEKYTLKFSDLDADLVDFVTNLPPTGATFHNRAFEFKISGEADADGRITATRNTGTYCIVRIYETGVVCCSGDEDTCDNINIPQCDDPSINITADCP